MIFITATDTGVGKTFFSQKIIESVAQIIDRREIAYYKPIQCGKDAKELFGNIFYVILNFQVQTLLLLFFLIRDLFFF